MGLKGKFKKGCLLTAILCVALYVGLFVGLWQTPPPRAPITWQVDFPKGSYAWSTHVCPNGNIAFVTEKMVYFISPTGDVISEHHPSGNDFGYGHLDKSGNLFVGGSDGYVYAYSSDGEERWVFHLPDKSIVSPMSPSRETICSVDGDGNVIVQVYSGELAVLSAMGELKQQIVFPFTISSGNSPIRINEDQFVIKRLDQNGSYELAMVDLAGNELWAQAIPGKSIMSFDLSGDVLVVYTLYGRMHVLSLDGTLLWSFQNPDPNGKITFHSSEGVVVVGKRIYYSSGSILFSIDNNGKTEWQLPNKGVAIPLEISGNRILLAEYTLTPSTNFLRDFIHDFSPFGLGYQQHDSSVELVEVENQIVTRRWVLPDNMILVNGLGKDGEVYGYTMADSKTDTPFTIYRFDL